ncbi:unnamed protein product [Rhizophagus irregularis]|nr:unnamed protein product [Rhizophagus irregularis]CAB5388416.1 unnamed protein product [Rhizophagus irregularis]
MKIFNISEIRKIRKGFIVTCLTRYRKYPMEKYKKLCGMKSVSILNNEHTLHVTGRLETWKNPIKYMKVTGLVPDSEEPESTLNP